MLLFLLFAKECDDGQSAHDPLERHTLQLLAQLVNIRRSGHVDLIQPMTYSRISCYLLLTRLGQSRVSVASMSRDVLLLVRRRPTFTPSSFSPSPTTNTNILFHSWCHRSPLFSQSWTGKAQLRCGRDIVIAAPMELPTSAMLVQYQSTGSILSRPSADL